MNCTRRSACNTFSFNKSRSFNGRNFQFASWFIPLPYSCSSTTCTTCNNLIKCKVTRTTTCCRSSNCNCWSDCITRTSIRYMNSGNSSCSTYNCGCSSTCCRYSCECNMWGCPISRTTLCNSKNPNRTITHLRCSSHTTTTIIISKELNIRSCCISSTRIG